MSTEYQKGYEAAKKEMAPKAKKKRQTEEELMMMAFMTGNMGSVYRMEAAAIVAE